MKQDQGFLKLRKIRAAQKIAKTVSGSQNRVYLPSDGLMLNIAGENFTDGRIKY
jgi:prohibitin 2